MRVVVFGAGAIGSLLGAYLQRSGVEVVLVGRRDHVAAIRASGLRVEGTTQGIFRVLAEETLDNPLSAEAAFLTVKAFDLSSSSESLARGLKTTTPTLALPNGLEVEGEILRGLQRGGWDDPTAVLVRGINSIPATLLGPGVVRQAGEGEILLPEPLWERNSTSVEFFEGLLRRAGVRVRTTKDFGREIWRKVLVNAAINPITADHRVLNGRLLEDPWRAQALQLLREAQIAARLAGYEFSDGEADRELWKVVRATAGNRSSMLQDVDRKGPNEIEAISGTILRIATDHGVDLPATRRAVGRLRTLSDSRSSQSS